MKLRSGLLSGPPAKPELVQLPLTQQNLRAFDETISGKNDSDTVSSDRETASVKSMPSSTDPKFPGMLQECGVYFKYPDVSPPGDMVAVLADLQKKRNSQEQLQAKIFFQRLEHSHNEGAYKFHFISVIFNPSSGGVVDQYSMHMDLEWTAVKPQFAVEKGLPKPKPDYFETFSVFQYPPKVRDALNWCISPSSHPIAMPTFCVEFKAPGKGPRNAIAQVAYDGAVMVDAAWEVHKYMKKPARDFFGKTQALVIAITDSYFELFACHAMPAVESKSGYPPKLSYHIYSLVCSTIKSEDDLKTVCLSTHNAQDWCRAQAESVKDGIQNFCEELEKSEMQRERKKYDAQRIASDTGRKKKKRKRKMDEAELKQDQQEQNAKKRKIRGSSGGSRSSASSTPGQTGWFRWPLG
jgi:hypothetical protein